MLLALVRDRTNTARRLAAVQELVSRQAAHGSLNWSRCWDRSAPRLLQTDNVTANVEIVRILIPARRRIPWWASSCQETKKWFLGVVELKLKTGEIRYREGLAGLRGRAGFRIDYLWGCRLLWDRNGCLGVGGGLWNMGIITGRPLDWTELWCLVCSIPLPSPTIPEIGMSANLSPTYFFLRRFYLILY